MQLRHVPHVMVFLGLCILSAPGCFAGSFSGDIPVGATQRSFTGYVPDGPAPAGGFAVVLAFHGGGMQGAGMRRQTGFDAVAQEKRFIVVYPDGVDRHWNDGRHTIKNPQDDVGFTRALIAWLKEKYSVNAGRLYATGISNGALFTERLGCELSGQIAAIAPVAGTLPVDLAPHCHPDRPVSVLQIDGTADPIMPFDGGAVADFGGRGEGGSVLSVAQTLSFWVRQNGCGDRPDESYPAPVVRRDPTRITQRIWTACRAQTSVKQLVVSDGGHSWPGAMPLLPRIVGRTSGQINATVAIAEFFLSLPERK